MVCSYTGSLHLLERGYPEKLIQTTLLEVKFEERELALQPKLKENKRILPFVTTYQQSVPNLKQILMKKMAFNRTTTITERNLQRSAPYFIQKRAFAQRYTRESQTIKKAITRTRESCRLVNPILHKIFASDIYGRLQWLVYRLAIVNAHTDLPLILCLLLKSRRPLRTRCLQITLTVHF